jgi:AcrR family transcriptional regulator
VIDAPPPFRLEHIIVAGLKAKQRQDTLSRIRISARALIAQDEDSGFTSRRIAAGAGISAGRLLQYYATLNDLIVELMEIERNEIFNGLEAAEKALPARLGWRKRVRALVKTMFELHFARAALVRRSMAYSWTWGRDVEEKMTATAKKLVNVLEPIVDDPADRLDPKLRETAALGLYRLFTHGLRHALQTRQDAETATTHLWPLVDLMLDGVDARRTATSAASTGKRVS